MDEILPKRKQLGLHNYDYNTPGAYFITICTHSRKCMLSRIVGAIHESPEPELTSYGKIVDSTINSIPKRYQAKVDSYVIMPNHIHLIVTVADKDSSRAIRESPLQGRSVISKLVGYIKMNVSKEIHAQYGSVSVWQRGFHDHIIRSQSDYDKIYKYIHENPYNWQSDCFYAEE